MHLSPVTNNISLFIMLFIFRNMFLWIWAMNASDLLSIAAEDCYIEVGPLIMKCNLINGKRTWNVITLCGAGQIWLKLVTHYLYSIDKSKSEKVLLGQQLSNVDFQGQIVRHYAILVRYVVGVVSGYGDKRL